MRRLFPLAKIVLWMFITYTVLTVLLSLLWVLVVEAGKPEPTPHVFIIQFLEKEFDHGALTGVLTGLAMAIYAGVDRWTIRRLAHFRIALLIVAAIVAVVFVGGHYHFAHLRGYEISLFALIAVAANNPEMITEPTTALLIFGTIAKYLAIGFMSLYVAGRFWREASQRRLKSRDESPTIHAETASQDRFSRSAPLTGDREPRAPG